MMAWYKGRNASELFDKKKVYEQFQYAQHDTRSV
jgi:hypothetical protein